MNITISHPLALKVYKYFTDMDERYSRKAFLAVMTILTVFIVAIYYFGTDFKALQTLQIDLNQEVSSIGSTEKLNPENALKHLMQDEEFVNNFSDKVTNSIPSMFWVCLSMLLSIPAIIKRTNDSVIFAKSHAYPVVIYYALYFFQGLTGLYIDYFMIYTALSLYASIFVILISLTPSKEKPKQIQEIDLGDKF